MSASTELAVALRDAARDATAVQPIVVAHPDLDEDDAYAVQRELMALHRADGAATIGFKLGLTSAAKQTAMGVHEPIYGELTDQMRRQRTAGGLIHPRIEPEVAFLLRAELAGEPDRAAVLAATDRVGPALEIIDSRYADFRFGLVDVIADNASSAGLVLGPLRAAADDLDWDAQRCRLTVDDDVVDEAPASAVMGHPADAVAWLVARLARHGRRLEAGALVLSGALTNAVPLVPGVRVRAEFTDLGVVEATG